VGCNPTFAQPRSGPGFNARATIAGLNKLGNYRTMKYLNCAKDVLLISLFLVMSLGMATRRDTPISRRDAGFMHDKAVFPNRNANPPFSDTVDLKAFAKRIIAGVQDNYEKARTLLAWLSTHFEWKYTDYQNRSVQEIIARKGGNCFEMATVYMALLRELDINYRPIAEVNIQKPDEERGKRAAQMVKEKGNTASVFGRQHNDHRWIEVYDDHTKEWVPADPTMNIIGFDQWLKARAWFGERHTVNDEFSREMIVPFGIFVVGKDDKTDMKENRTRYYLVDRLDALYDHKLSGLPSWSKWVSALQALSNVAKNAFEGKENLQEYDGQIGALARIYQELRQEYMGLS